jgi:hypothetical protein
VGGKRRVEDVAYRSCLVRTRHTIRIGGLTLKILIFDITYVRLPPPEFLRRDDPLDGENVTAPSRSGQHGGPILGCSLPRQMLNYGRSPIFKSESPATPAAAPPASRSRCPAGRRRGVAESRVEGLASLQNRFSWKDLGDPATGRPNLGLFLPVCYVSEAFDT